MKISNPFAFLKAIFTPSKPKAPLPAPEPTHLSPLRKNPMHGIACAGPKPAWSRHIDGVRDTRAAFGRHKGAIEPTTPFRDSDGIATAACFLS